MRILLRKFVTRFVNKKIKSKLKKIEYKAKKKIISKFPKLDEQALREIISNDLGIRQGDNIFLHGSTDMVRTDLSPSAIVSILLDIVGEEGSLSVPTFIRYSSKEWMKKDEKFNYRRTISGMGMLSESVRRNKYSARSLHPTKSVATIGPIANEILGEHHLSEYAFDKKSPFFKLLKFNVKVIGFGVPMSYLSMVHTVEDCNINEYPINVNEQEIYSKICVTEDNREIEVKCHVHDISIVAKANPEKFVRKYLERGDYVIKRHYFSSFFMVDGNRLYNELCTQMINNKTIYD